MSFFSSGLLSAKSLIHPYQLMECFYSLTCLLLPTHSGSISCYHDRVLFWWCLSISKSYLTYWLCLSKASSDIKGCRGYLCRAEETKHFNCEWSHSETESAGAQTVIWVCCYPCPFISASPSVFEYMLSSKAHRAADRSPRQMGSHRLFVSAQAIEIPGESPLLAGAGSLDIANQAHRALNAILTRKLSEAMQILQMQFFCYCL